MEFRQAAIEELFQFQHLALVVEVRPVSLSSLGMAFPSGSRSQWNHPSSSLGLFTGKGFLLYHWSHWQWMLSRSPVSQGGKGQVGRKVTLVDQDQGQDSFSDTHQ